MTRSDKIVTHKKYELSLIVISGREFYINLLFIYYGSYDVILDMDWLCTFHTIVDCRRRKVIF